MVAAQEARACSGASWPVGELVTLVIEEERFFGWVASASPAHSLAGVSMGSGLPPRSGGFATKRIGGSALLAQRPARGPTLLDLAAFSSLDDVWSPRDMLCGDHPDDTVAL